jgi:hypothetical protein
MRTLSLILTLISFSLAVHAGHPNKEAKNSDSKRWKNGFVVTLSGDTLHGKVKINDYLDTYYDYQRLLSFRDGHGTTQYTPNDLRSFSYIDNQSTATMQSVSSPEGDGRVFLRLYCSGSCKVYGFVITGIKGSHGAEAGDGLVRSSLIPTEKKYMQIGGSQFYQFKRGNFKKCMQEAFASCPHILSRLNSKAYTYDNIQALVDDYNRGIK